MSSNKNLLVSFSGGETSAYMAQWLKANAHKHGFTNVVYVFANTGQENEETLEFAHKCDVKWGLDLHWVEANVHHGIRKRSSHNMVDYETASRDGEPFEEVIKKYGIPNMASPHCTRELKQNPIKAFAKEYFGKEKCWTAIGIRMDEIDRMSSERESRLLLYPLIEMRPMTKEKINFWWNQQDFRLNLKGYQGNCITCWKKSQAKLYTIAQENPEAFRFMSEMEHKYPRVGPEFKKDPKAFDRVFFRSRRSANDILKESESWNGKVLDDSIKYGDQIDMFESESCEVFTQCGVDN